ncbi:hypothetical protein [Neolewinella persica]|uniref:hypothetical protein n=1 Tax=Neolewinella persica TaxID=70998 RepID=UPI0012F7B301|nr:hypothetical protein [Neolewinella persica]
MLSCFLLCLLSGCNTQQQHPTGVYLSTCSTEDGRPYDGFMIFQVDEDSITVRPLNDFLRGSSTQSLKIPTTIFTEPFIYDYDEVFADTITATITEAELTMKSTGISDGVEVANRLKHQSLRKVHLADNRMVANKVFERWSDRSRWTFSADNRLEVMDYQNKDLYEFEYVQLYSIDSFANYRILNIHPNHKQKYFINAVTKSYIALETVGCVSIYDTLRYVKDTFIESILPPAAVLAEEARYVPKTYSTYWYETLWTFTFMNNGIFKYLPRGHFSSGHLWMGKYQEKDGVIDLDYRTSEFADFRPASDPIRLFRLDSNNLRWPNGALITRNGAEEGKWEDLFYELVDVCKQLVAENKFGVSDETYPYISAEIIAVNPEVMVRFRPGSRRNGNLAPQLIDTLSLAEIRQMYPYVAPSYK